MQDYKYNFNAGYIITDDKFNILYCNKYFKKNIIGTEILNKKITVFFQDIKVDMEEELYSVKSIDNSVYYVTHNKFKLYNYQLYSFFFYDFSIGKELQKQISRLNSQQYLYNEMLNKLKDGIYVTDEVGTTIYVNDAFLNLSGLRREQIIGKTVYELRKNNILPNSCCAKVIETNGPVTTINNYYQGQRCLVSGSPIYDEEGNLSKTIAVIRDVSELDVLMKTITKEENLYKSDYKVKEKVEDNSSKIVVNNEKMKNIYKKAKNIQCRQYHPDFRRNRSWKGFHGNYIHRISNRNKGRFIKINCSAVPEHLLESEFLVMKKVLSRELLKEERKDSLKKLTEELCTWMK